MADPYRIAPRFTRWHVDTNVAAAGGSEPFATMHGTFDALDGSDAVRQHFAALSKLGFNVLFSIATPAPDGGEGR